MYQLVSLKILQLNYWWPKLHRTSHTERNEKNKLIKESHQTSMEQAGIFAKVIGNMPKKALKMFWSKYSPRSFVQWLFVCGFSTPQMSLFEG